MEKAKFEDVTLDYEDAKIFQLKDTELLIKAKAIKYSIVPKLNILLEEALSRIRRVYGIEVFNEGMHLYSTPNYRENRESDFTVNYDSAMIGITGARKEIWKGFKRLDNKPVKIMCYSLNFGLSENGLNVYFWTSNNLKLTDESYKKYFYFLKENMSIVQTIQSLSEMNPRLSYRDNNSFVIIPFDEYLTSIIEDKYYTLGFSRIIKFPITLDDLNSMVNSFVIFYPVYDSVVKLAKGEEVRFKELVSKIKLKDILYDSDTSDNYLTKDEEMEIISKNIDTKNTAKAGVRWQVFERDNFRCVACGKSATDGAILHVDHIIPRSKGGKDELDNYQTLCHLCNIGKSNKSQLNLRMKNGI